MTSAILQTIVQRLNVAGLPVHEFAGGQINHTFQIGENFVVKIQKDLDVLLHQVSLTEQMLKVGAKVPEIVDSGLLEGKEYVVMRKIPGQKLSEQWHTFSDEQKDQFVAQIAEQLKLIHSISFGQYSPQRPLEFPIWKDAMIHYTDFSMLDGIELDTKAEEIVGVLKNHFYQHIEKLNETDTSVLVHNDLHFENILFDGDTITGVFDFDFARQAPKDYELWHLIDFFHTPAYFVEENLEDIWKKFECRNELALFKKHYPELFAEEYLLERLRIYFMEDMMGHIANGYQIRARKKFESYFNNGWLENVLCG
jgi:aminoglycoside phosphotransferase (APT) family kinase protein